MKAVVVYESMWGNTALIAQAVAKGLGDVRAMDVARASAAELEDVDLLVLGGPTHAFSMSRATTRGEAHQQGAHHGPAGRGIRNLIRELPDPLLARVATFDTKVAKVRRLPGSAARAAAKVLRRHHEADVIATESFYVEDTPGPLMPDELERAVAWGKELARITGIGRQGAPGRSTPGPWTSAERPEATGATDEVRAPLAHERDLRPPDQARPRLPRRR